MTNRCLWPDVGWREPRLRSRLVARVRPNSHRGLDAHSPNAVEPNHCARRCDCESVVTTVGHVAPSAYTPAARCRRWARDEGSPLPLGVTWLPDEHAYNFALYSKHAERVVLLAFRDDEVSHTKFSLELDYLHHKSGRIWHCRVPLHDLRGAQYYAFSVAGPPPEGPFDWHAFDPDKLLLDPYARAVFFPATFDPAAAKGRGPNIGRAPLGVLPRPTGAAAAVDQRPLASQHESDAIVYELHVRNFTRHESSGIEPEKRGTFAGLIEKVPYLVDLGVTIVELMPVFQFDPSGQDRWGYMPLSFFAVHRGYASDPAEGAAEAELRQAIDALHAAGIEVILDVVYNHTAERDSEGPVYSFKGIDASTYYLMTGNPVEPYANYSGTGNTMNCANSAVRKMILDSMRRWVRLGIDGFRFDLASIFARDSDGTIRYEDPPILGEISEDPEFANIRLIAEPWDMGAYQLGRRFPGMRWQQWNGAFRDDVRRFLRGDAGCVPAAMCRLYGSDDLFPDDRINAYRPSQSVNYVTSHDGPTLYDLLSYTRKRNWANGLGNVDGPPENFASNCGWEGDEQVRDDVERRRVVQAKNHLTLLFLANGTPMLRGGDEFLHTQNGNDNPFNQDNDLTWLDWTRAERYAEVLRFTRLAIAFRKAHASLGRSRFWRNDVAWFGVREHVDISYDSHAFAFCLSGASQGDVDIYAMINAWTEPVTFELQIGRAAEWRRVIDTSLPSPDDFRDTGTEATIASSEYVVASHSVVVFVRTAQMH